MITINKQLTDSMMMTVPSGAVVFFNEFLSGNLANPQLQVQVLIYKDLAAKNAGALPLIFDEYGGQIQTPGSVGSMGVNPFETINADSISDIDTLTKIEALLLPLIATRLTGQGVVNEDLVIS